MNPAQAKPTAPTPTTPTQATPRPSAEALLLCPYCGGATPNASRCAHCRGLLDPLSRQASQNAMGPWFIRDPLHPFRPGCSYETIAIMVRRGKLAPQTIIRGPTTKQFWSIARRTPGVANLLGHCHACGADVQPHDHFCDDCGASFVVETDRHHLGLASVHLLPGQATPEDIASAGARAGAPAVGHTPPQGAPAGHGLQEAAAVRRVLERRLRTQRRMVAALLLLLVIAGVSGVWAGFRLVPGSPLAAWLSEVEQGLVGTPAPSPRSTPPAPAPSSVAIPPEPKAPTTPPPSFPTPPAIHPDQPSPAEGTHPGTPVPEVVPTASPTAPAPATAPVADPGGVWGHVQELVKRDTKDSLTEAQSLLKADRPASVSKDVWDSQLIAVSRRLEQLKLRGLP